MKTLLIDLDGTMYRGNEPIPQAFDFLKRLNENKIPYIFLTNNAMRTREENALHMQKMGFSDIRPEMFYNSAMAAARWAAGQKPGAKAFVIGMEGLKQALREAGMILSDDHPDFVFVGLDTKADYALYSKALSLLLQGAVLVGTNRDRILPDGSSFLVGNGAIVAMLEYASGQKSVDIGKPGHIILDTCLEHFSIPKEDAVLLGDNLETDIALGYNNSVETIFVPTGVHTMSDIQRLKILPDHVAESLDAIGMDAFL